MPPDHPLIDTLTGIVGAAGVVSGAEDIAPYAIDWRRLFSRWA